MASSYLPEGSQVVGTPLERSNVFRRQGNDLYCKAREVARNADPYTNLRGVQESVKLFQAAMAEYGKALHFLPNDHRLFGNRALCYQAVEDWVKCREDAQRCVKLKSDYTKGWLLLVKATWELGHHHEAMQELQNGLRAIPGSRELVDLQAGLTSGHQARVAGRSVSPACTPGNTPPVSRSTTPPRSFTPPPGPPGHMSATLPAISQGTGSGRSPGCSRTSSRSPGAARPCPPPAPPGPGPGPPRAVPGLEGSLTCGTGTGNFGVPTPSFAHGQPPSSIVASAVAEASIHSAFTLQATGSAAATIASVAGAAGAAGARRVNSPGPAFVQPAEAEDAHPEGHGDGSSPNRKISSLKSLSESGRR
mmetsp:Transcript_42765/g.99825  ORF Transcript_42765/g.99825 Transcript_42765/m.99825 type:complete len:363 (-) Transcript_42765:193-1281(-)